jgi:hypothetical protein
VQYWLTYFKDRLGIEPVGSISFFKTTSTRT